MKIIKTLPCDYLRESNYSTWLIECNERLQSCPEIWAVTQKPFTFTFDKSAKTFRKIAANVIKADVDPSILEKLTAPAFEDGYIMLQEIKDIFEPCHLQESTFEAHHQETSGREVTVSVDTKRLGTMLNFALTGRSDDHQPCLDEQQQCVSRIVANGGTIIFEPSNDSRSESASLLTSPIFHAEEQPLEGKKTNKSFESHSNEDSDSKDEDYEDDSAYDDYEYDNSEGDKDSDDPHDATLSNLSEDIPTTATHQQITRQDRSLAKNLRRASLRIVTLQHRHHKLSQRSKRLEAEIDEMRLFDLKFKEYAAAKEAGSSQKTLKRLYKRQLKEYSLAISDPKQMEFQLGSHGRISSYSKMAEVEQESVKMQSEAKNCCSHGTPSLGNDHEHVGMAPRW